MKLKDQQFLDYIADKILEHSNTLFAVCCSSKISYAHKGFFLHHNGAKKKVRIIDCKVYFTIKNSLSEKLMKHFSF